MDDKVTINSIAKKSGFSLSTVSMVLNNKPGISPKTRTQVIEIAKSLGYAYRQNSAQAKPNRLNTLGMIVKADHDLGPHENPFYSRVIMGIEDACRRNRINLMFVTLPVDALNHPVETPALLYNNTVDGVLMVGAFVDKTIVSVTGHATPPIVLVDAYATGEEYDTVISDNFQASYRAVEYLIGKGHRHIGLVGGSPDCYPSLCDRRNGYYRALKENEIVETYTAEFNINISKGYAEVSKMLAEHPQISALFCINDVVALTSMRAAQDLGRRIPADLSVIGYDDISMAQDSIPSLTTMRVDAVSMGNAAVQLLSFRLENPNAVQMTLTLRPTLIERDSVSQR
jgi:LacI family transcriptional regulator